MKNNFAALLDSGLAKYKVSGKHDWSNGKNCGKEFCY